MKKIDYSNFEELYKKGLSDSKIAKELNCSKRAITIYRNKLSLKSNFIKTMDQYNNWSKEKFMELYLLGLTDKKIAKELCISEGAVNSYRLKQNLVSNQSHNIDITKEMEELIVGTLLGDGYINTTSKSKIKKEKDTGILIFGHCEKQKDYCFHKYEKLKSLFNNEPRKTIQTRLGKKHTSYYAITKSSISLKKYRDLFYIEKEKIIPKDIEKYFTPMSLAYLYMDDGNRHNGSYYIALNNFSIDSISNLQLLLEKWNITTTIMKSRVLYIKAKSRINFENLIRPYIVETMMYKIRSL